MSSSWKTFAYIMSANFQAGIILYLSIKASEYLNANHPSSFSWHKVLLPAAIVSIFYLYYKVLRAIERFLKK